MAENPYQESPYDRATNLADGLLGLRDNIANPAITGLPIESARAICRAVASTGFQNVPLNNRTGVGFACEPYWEDEGIPPPLPDNPNEDGTYVPPGGALIRFRGTAGNIVTQTVSQYTVSSRPPGVTGKRLDWFVCNGAAGPGGNIQEGSIEVLEVGVCAGNPQPPPIGSEPAPGNPGTPYGSPQPINVGGDQYNLTVGAPSIDLTGNLSFPVTIDVGGIQIAPTLNIGSGLGPPSLPANPDPTKDGEPTDSDDNSGDVDDDDEVDDDFETVGYRWDLIGLPDNISAVPATEPKVLVTPYGNIQLKFQTESGLILYSDNLPIRVESGSLIRRLDSLKVTGVSYSKRPDVGSIRLTPIRAKIKES